MSKFLQLFGDKEQKLPTSIIKDPFAAECIDSINIWVHKPLFPKRGEIFRFEADINFKRGNTEGKQTIEGTDLIDLYNKLKDFCESLE